MLVLGYYEADGYYDESPIFVALCVSVFKRKIVFGFYLHVCLDIFICLFIFYFILFYLLFLFLFFLFLFIYLFIYLFIDSCLAIFWEETVLFVFLHIVF